MFEGEHKWEVSFMPFAFPFKGNLFPLRMTARWKAKGRKGLK